MCTCIISGFDILVNNIVLSTFVSATSIRHIILLASHTPRHLLSGGSEEKELRKESLEEDRNNVDLVMLNLTQLHVDTRFVFKIKWLVMERADSRNLKMTAQLSVSARRMGYERSNLRSIS